MRRDPRGGDDSTARQRRTVLKFKDTRLAVARAAAAGVTPAAAACADHSIREGEDAHRFNVAFT